jgi:hypothetical protein
MQSEEPCAPCELDLETEWRELDALAVVNIARSEVIKDKSTRRVGREQHRVICTLWCGHVHPAGDTKQPSVTCNQSTVPSIEHAVRALRLKIQDKHADCIAVAEAARGCCRRASHAASTRCARRSDGGSESAASR